MTTTKAPKQLAFYMNGNCAVQIFDDGTKVRDSGSEDPWAEFPESIDLKITDYCDAGCKWCHEQSTVNGSHAGIETICDIVHGLPTGVEIAIGGGNPLSHPDLFEILRRFKAQGLISNLTVNALHVRKAKDIINELRYEQLIWGLGVSHHPGLIEDINSIVDDNTVVHLIAGIHSPFDLRRLKAKKFLILGYKQFGFGVKYFSKDVEWNIRKWRYWIGPVMAKHHVSFDNLALSQLDVRMHATAEFWDRHFMGNDGQFTMYVDAVLREFAVSSTSPRHALNDLSIREAFNQVRSNYERINS